MLNYGWSILPYAASSTTLRMLTNFSKSFIHDLYATASSSGGSSSSGKASSSSSSNGGRVFASPLARSIAKEEGYDISQIKGNSIA
jgi:pyruvate/2-oxoglutarate dehydrogenase complex dihydrolipoamide acyltransferase (E2) component